MSVLVILGRKCTLAASRLHLMSHVENAPRAIKVRKNETDRQTKTDGRTPLRLLLDAASNNK